MAAIRPINVEETVDSPKIILDSTNLLFSIEGSSFPEDATEIYGCVLDWIKDNEYKFDDELICKFKYKVLSSASRKVLYDVFLALEKASENSKVFIHWYYEDNDEDILEVGQDFEELLELPFVYVSY